MSAPCPGIDDELAVRLRGARRLAVVGIGDELQRGDRLGLVAAREIENLSLPDVRVFLAGTTPESFTGPIRRSRPDHVLLLDAAHFGGRPGAVAVIAPEKVRGEGLSTHALPLPVLMEYLGEKIGVPVTLVGLQPDLAARGPALTPVEESGITRLVACLQRLLSARPASAGRKARRRTRGPD